MSAIVGSEDPAGLQVPQLIKQLCIHLNQADLDRVAHQPQQRSKLLRTHLDVAYSLILGMRPVRRRARRGANSFCLLSMIDLT